MTFKTLINSRPIYLFESLTHQQSARNLRSNDKHLLVVPRISSAAAERGFSVSGPTVWNSLSCDTRSATSFDAFKSKLKTELFVRAFRA